MAEIAVSILIDKLIPLLTGEVRLLKGVEGEISYIKDQLRLIRAYLKDADAKAETGDASELVKEWVEQVREVAYRTEDVVDEYLFKVAKRGQRHGLVGAVRKTGHLFKSIIPRHEISNEIGEIRKSLARLREGKETFGFNPSALEPSSRGKEISVRNDLRLGAHFLDDDQLVGIDKTREILNGWLLKPDSQRIIISVVGVGGLGKTTLVNKVYKKQKEERSFDCYAWIIVSRPFKEENLLKSMIASFHGEDKFVAKRINGETLDKETLIRKLREYLQERRYLIVFDDVWDIDFWKVVDFALPNNKKSNRIMITTRDRGVAEFCTSFALCHIHDLEPLPLDDALKLFHLKAFRFDVEGCPEELIGLSQEFAEKCDGVPLAIAAIAGLLSTKKKNVFEWQKVYDSLRSKLAIDPHLRGCYQVLSESYNDLPCHLKSCLLYFGLFPEDWSISCVRLINLWIAEGFIKEKDIEDMTLEEVAEEYLDELIRRSLVQVSKVYSSVRVLRCRVHDLMHYFILKKCMELNFCQVKKNEKFRFHAWTRRLSIDTNKIVAYDPKSFANYCRLRSCFVFNFEELPKDMLESLLSSFRLLVALDFEDAPLNYLPEPVGNLLHLKYLSLKNTNIQTIPKFIGKLQKLETLDLKHSLVRELPAEINKLLKLRNLIAYSFHFESHFTTATYSGVKLKKGIGCLKALQKLSTIDISNEEDIIEELKNLEEMRRLDIMQLRRQNGKNLCNAIERMKHICSLTIDGAEENEVVDLHSLNDPPQSLQRFYLRARLEKLPMWITKLKNLVLLNLTWSGLTEDPLSVLKELPELVVLRLRKSYEGDILYFKDGWFKKLKKLEIRDFPGLRDLKIGEKALPSLDYLYLALCPQMVEVPLDIQNLEALQVLRFDEMPDQLIEAMKQKGGRIHDIINNIPTAIYFKNGILSSLKL